MAYFEYKLYLEEQQRKKSDELQKAAETEKVIQEKRQLQKMKESILEQLRTEEEAENEQKRELCTTKELLREASTRMAIAVQNSKMQFVKVAQMMLKARNDKLQETTSKLEVIQSNQKSLRKRLNLCWSIENKT